MTKGSLYFSILVFLIIFISGCTTNTTSPEQPTKSISNMLLSNSDVGNLGFIVVNQREIDTITIRHCAGFISAERTSFTFTDKDVMDKDYNVHPGIINEIAEFISQQSAKDCFREKKQAKIDTCAKYPRSCENKELILTPVVGDDSIIEKSITSNGVSYGVHFVSGKYYAYIWILNEADITLDKFVQLSKIVENKI